MTWKTTCHKLIESSVYGERLEKCLPEWWNELKGIAMASRFADVNSKEGELAWKREK